MPQYTFECNLLLYDGKITSLGDNNYTYNMYDAIKTI